METGKVLELATIFGAAAVLAALAYLSAVGLYTIDNFGRASAGAAFAGGDYQVINVVGRRFSWFFYYNGTMSVNELRVRAGRLYLLNVTADDVVHSFYIRELGIKYDAVPGFAYHIWLKVERPGVYNVLCAEYCGAGHYLMVGKIVVE